MVDERRRSFVCVVVSAERVGCSLVACGFTAGWMSIWRRDSSSDLISKQAIFHRLGLLRIMEPWNFCAAFSFCRALRMGMGSWRCVT